MPKPVRIIAIALVVIVICSVVCVEALQETIGRQIYTNPPTIAEPQWDKPQTRALFMRACGDCHSNQTTWPWYSHIPPISWLTINDVIEGRQKFNISEWGQGRNRGREAAETVQRGRMPPAIYLPLHPSARLTDSEKQDLIQGLRATFGSGEGGD